MACAARALEGFYRREKLPAGGHDGARIDWARAFGLPVPIVNTRARLEVLPYHDVHHLVTGYRTDEAGEAEPTAPATSATSAVWRSFMTWRAVGGTAGARFGQRLR